MKKTFIIVIIIFHMALLATGCQPVPDVKHMDEKGRPCGVVEGSFRGRWWNYYERGQSFADCRMWEKAEADYQNALEQRKVDGSRARTYGMNMVAYFAHRELGVSLYNQGRYDEATSELETSLGQETSSKAQYYLDQTRKEHILSHNLDHAEPEIHLANGKDHGPTRSFTWRLKGVAADDTYVKYIHINDRDFPIDLGSPRIPFEAEVPLRPGINDIRIQAVDICGKTTIRTISVTCDRSGPLVSIESITPTDRSLWVKGNAVDPSGIRSVMINGAPLPISPGTDISFNYSCPVDTKVNPMTITVEDHAGNITTAAVEKNVWSMGGLNRSGEDILLASNDIPPLTGHDSEGSKVAGSAWEPPLPRSRITSSTPAINAPKIASNTDSAHGHNYALIVGINNYEAWPILTTAVNDAKELARILTSRYGFSPVNITLLLDPDATAAKFYDTLMNITGSMGEKDDLLVYFAGHGIIHPLANDGYWIPVKGQKGDAFWTWVAHSSIQNLISSCDINGKNIMVITDSCYGGRLLRGGETGPLARRGSGYLLPLSLRKSRQIISSGSLEPVVDSGRDNHSLFAYYLLKALKENTETSVALSSLVSSYVYKKVYENSGKKQRPVIGRFQTPMDEDGEFVLHMSGSALPEDPALALAALLKKPGTHQRGAEPDRTDKTSDTAVPEITLESWGDTQTVFLDQAYIEGRFFDQGGISSIRVNGRNLSIKQGMTVYFNELFRLELGDNVFVLEAFDVSGNRTRKQIHIFRQQPKVDATTSRLTAVMLPYRTTGEMGQSIRYALFDYVADSRRFNLKEWAEHTNGSPTATEFNDNPEALAFSYKEKGIDCTLSGTILMHEDQLEMRTQVISLASQSVLASADVYGENLDREKIRNLCQGLVYKLCRDLPVIEGQVARVKGRELTINRGEHHGLKNGMPLILFQEETVLDPETGETLGVDRHQTATAYIKDIGEKLSHAVLTDDPAEVVQVGQKVITR